MANLNDTKTVKIRTDAYNLVKDNKVKTGVPISTLIEKLIFSKFKNKLK